MMHKKLCKHSKMIIKSLSKLLKLWNHLIKVRFQTKINNKFTVKIFLKDYKVKIPLIKNSKKFNISKIIKKIFTRRFYKGQINISLKS
jgi:hypothetical protein